MGQELELLQKMDLTAENRQKLEALITEAKKTGKVSSKHLVETLDDVDATQDQTERFYDILEQAGIEIDVSDVLDLIGSADMDNPTLSEMQAIEDEGLPEDLETPEALPEDVETAKLDDPVRMYLKEIGRIKLLSPEEEQEVARAMAEGDEKTREAARKRMSEANLRLAVSIAKRYVGRAPSPTRRARSASPCTWWRPSTGCCAPRTRWCRSSAASRRRRRSPTSCTSSRARSKRS